MRTLSQLHQHLQQCEFEAFWKLYTKHKALLKEVLGFEKEVRKCTLPPCTDR